MCYLLDQLLWEIENRNTNFVMNSVANIYKTSNTNSSHFYNKFSSCMASHAPIPC
jgi:hypothetical protein